MANIKHYGTADLYDPDHPTGDVPAGAYLDPVALGRNVRAFMRNRVRRKTISNPVSKADRLDNAKLKATTRPSHPRNAQELSFTNLPGEIRNTIYSLLLFPYHRSLLAIAYSHPLDIFSTLLRSPLFRVSRQIRAEALSFLAATKDFRLPGITTATTFFRYLGPVGRVSLTEVTIAILSTRDVDLAGGKELLRLVREVKGPGRKRFMVGIQGHLKMEESAWVFFKHLKQALEEGCEEMEVKWYLLDNNLPGVSSSEVGRTVQGMEMVFGSDSRVQGSMWTLVDAKTT